MNHRIIEWFGLEGTLKLSWFQPPCHEQGHLPPAQAAQSSIQPGLEPCQGGGSHSFSGQCGPGFHHPHGEEFLPNMSSKSALFWFRAVPPCPITPPPCEKSLAILPVGPSGTGSSSKVTPEPSLLQAEQPQLSQPFLIGEVFQPSDLFRGLLWTCSNRSMSLLC